MNDTTNKTYCNNFIIVSLHRYLHSITVYVLFIIENVIDIIIFLFVNIVNNGMHSILI